VSNYTLELFNGREYEPTPHHMVNPDTLADIGRDLIRPADFPGFRVVKAGHKYPKRIRRWTPSKASGYARTVEGQQDTYFAWAKAAGLRTVHVYAGQSRLVAGEGRVTLGEWAERLGFAGAWEVDPADFIGPAPRAQIDPPAYCREAYMGATA
jgi:hypothetical protein